MIATDFPALLQAFFTERLLKQRRASAHTVTAYRNTFRLLLRFAATRLGRVPSQLELTDLDPAFLGEFLDHLERERGNSARSRNARLAALHAFFRFVAFTAPAHALLCQRVLAIPSKRFERGLSNSWPRRRSRSSSRSRHRHLDRTARPRAPPRGRPRQDCACRS